MLLEAMLDTSDRANAILRGALLEHRALLDRRFETLSAYDTIARIVAHIAGAEERWIAARVLGEAPASRFEERAPAEPEALFEAWAEIRAKSRRALALDLARPIPFELPQWGVSGTMTGAEMFAHVLLHEASHRGAILMALQRMAVDPPNLDWPLV